MLKIGDTVKVTGKTLDGSGIEREVIPSGTICSVIDAFNGMARITPKNLLCNGRSHWYFTKDLKLVERINKNE